ncbi:MarR family winged helix-turn-helix transcriptional regulator [Solicola gregarius]|uniref:MarR family transcriptional regulator n=1 Tax=Solicola gregarius TaxID=2908642 RepID=A0AA46TF86_9ACTN|nr:MarR family transcriptional regulator [Solicola gregarius]UYM04254.1 MarR family transcriptional regulator [Solicola gregarius]
MTQAPSTSDTHWLDDDQQRDWRAFLGGSTVLFERLDRDLRESHNLSMPEYEILVRLSEAPSRRMRMAELAASVAQSRSRTTHTIARLQNAGLVAREASPDDGRGVLAQLTTAGLSRLEEAAHTHVRGVREYLVDAVSPDDFAAIGRAFDAIRRELHGKPF